MIKLVAAVLMAIDHIGLVFFPNVIYWRLIGRLSMPLFAYSIARGYGHSRENGTLNKYLLNMTAFAVISQIPYYLVAGKGTNIGFTWFFSLLLLIILDGAEISRFRAILACLVVLTAAFLLDVDYGVYGVFMPLAMRHKWDRAFLYTVILWALYILLHGAAGLTQSFSCAAVPLLALLEPIDGKIRLPRRFFYIFYPAHLLALYLMKSL